MKHTTRLKLIKIVFAIVIIILLFVPASVSHPQIDMRALVVAIGLDQSQNQIKLTADVVLPKEGGGATGISKVITKQAKTLPQALDSISTALGRKLELNHCGIIVLSNEYASNNPTPDFEYLLSSGRVCPEINLVVANEQSANDFLQSLSEYSQKLDLSNLLRYTDLGIQNYTCSLTKFLRDSQSKSASVALASLKMCKGDSSQNQENQENQQNQDNQDNQQNQQNQQNQDEMGLICSAKNTAIFKTTNNKTQLVDTLGEHETFGLAWLDSQTKKGYVFVEQLQYNGQTLKNIPLQIVYKKSRLVAKIDNNQPTLNINLKVKLTIEDRHLLNQNKSQGKMPTSLKTALQKEVCSLISDAINQAYTKAKQQDIDILKIQDTFYRQKNAYFKTHSNLLQDAKLKVNCKIQIN